MISAMLYEKKLSNTDRMSYEAPEAEAHILSIERNILCGSNPGPGEIEVPGEEPGEN